LADSGRAGFTRTPAQREDAGAGVLTKSKVTSADSDAIEMSQNERAYALLKDKLTTLAYPPGDFLNIATLVGNLAIGRTPINHALHRLATEGLVQIIPRKGVVVSPLSIDDALHLIDVRLANERLCAQLAATRITAAEVADLRSVAAAFDAAVPTRDMPLIMNCDRLFHERIAAASGNSILIEILKVLHARSQRFWAISLASEGHLAEVTVEHQEIVDALAANDVDAAVRCVEAHIFSFRQSLLRGR
jgi:DNA-binding GntR family transcriptional regulator